MFLQLTQGWIFCSVKAIIAQPIEQWKDDLKNDFENPVYQQYPVINECKTALYNAGALYASMTGSGSTVYGIFKKDATPQLNFPAQYFVKII